MLLLLPQQQDLYTNKRKYQIGIDKLHFLIFNMAMDKREEDMEELKEGIPDSVGTEESRKYFHPSPSSDLYAGSPQPRSGRKIPFILGIAVIILILGGLFYFLKARPVAKVEPSPSPAVSLEGPSPQPSPSPSFDRAKYTLRVLNGTSTQGLAASTSAKLKDLGYKIEKVANATNSAFLKTVVRVKPDLEELLENLLKDLSGLDFEGEMGPELKDSDTSDGEVILGAK